MNENFNGNDNQTDFTPAENENREYEAVEALEETIGKFESDEKKQFDRHRFERKAETGGRRFGRYTRTALEFAGDSIGLLILKNSGNRDLAYKVLKGSRKAAETAESVLGTTVREGGKVLGEVAEQVDVDYLKERAHEVKEDMTRKVKNSDMAEKIEPEHMKAKAKDMYHKATDKVKEGKDKIFKNKYPSDDELMKPEVEGKMKAFDKLYDEEVPDHHASADEGYTPEEVKETK